METWLILAGISVLFLCLIATLIALLLYSGVFETVDVGAGRPPIGGVVIAYKFARGPYKEVGPLFFEVAKIAPDNKALGIYYDNPVKVESHRLRHAVASILAEDEQEVDEEQKKKFEAEGFKIMELPRLDSVVRASFPYKSTFSIFIAVHKVYPKLKNYIQQFKLCAHPFLEIYEGQTIQFMVPLSRQAEFYVPEAVQDFPGEVPYESIYADESTQDVSQSDLSTSVGDTSKTEPSLLDSPEMAKAVRSGTGREASGKTDTEAGTKTEVETVASLAAGVGEAEPGSDEDSSSSFEQIEEVKLEGGEKVKLEGGEKVKVEGEGVKVEGEGMKLEGDEKVKVEGEEVKVEGEEVKVEGEKVEGEGVKVEGVGMKLEGDEKVKEEGEEVKVEGEEAKSHAQ